MGWGSGPRGRMPWGSALAGPIVAPAIIELSALEVLSEDTLLLTFSEPMANGDLLQALESYTIIPESVGVPVDVTRVRAGGDDFTDTVSLVITKPTLGARYTLTVSAFLVAASGAVMNPNFLSKQFDGRNTKMDKALRILPTIYDKRHTSNIRTLMQVFMREDDAIGGSREDFLA